MYAGKWQHQFLWKCQKNNVYSCLTECYWLCELWFLSVRRRGGSNVTLLWGIRDAWIELFLSQYRFRYLPMPSTNPIQYRCCHFPKVETCVPHCVELVPNLFVWVSSGPIPDPPNKVHISGDTDLAYEISASLVRVDEWVDKASDSTKEIAVPISYRQSSLVSFNHDNQGSLTMIFP